MASALLLMAHGSRREEANADLEWVAAELSLRGRYAIIEYGYLELAEPGIEAAAARCVQRGAKRVCMVPFFLSAGVHVANDLQEIRNQLGQKHRGVDFFLSEPIGRHPLIVDIVDERAQQCQRNSAAGTFQEDHADSR